MRIPNMIIAPLVALSVVSVPAYAAESMRPSPMHNDAMGKDAAKKDPMKKDAMQKGPMKKDAMSQGSMKK